MNQAFGAWIAWTSAIAICEAGAIVREKNVVQGAGSLLAVISPIARRLRLRP